MIPIQCRKCGHIQDAGSALVPNDTCERCGLPIYGPKARNPTTMAVLSVVTLVGAAFLWMPAAFLLLLGVLSLFLVGNAIVRRKAGFAGQQEQCDQCGRSMTIVAGGGPGTLSLAAQEAAAGVGAAERCTACGRVWCADCYPSRPRNSCPCGQGRDKRYQAGGVVYTGPIRLIKVFYG